MDDWYEAPRFFISPDAITKTGDSHSAVLSGDEAHHAARVMRIKVGAYVVLLDGLGHEFYGRVAAVQSGRDGAEIRVEQLQQREAPTEPPFPVHLVQALPKGDKLEFVLQKGTEVGVTSFWPVMTKRVVVSYTAKKAQDKHARWKRIAAEAAKQSRRGLVPEVHPPARLDDVVGRLIDEGCRVLVFWEQATTPLSTAVNHWLAKKQGPDPKTGIAVVVGPEGGLASEEVEPLVELGAACVSLGPRILRTETAGMLAPALALFALTDGQ